MEISSVKYYVSKYLGSRAHYTEGTSNSKIQYNLPSNFDYSVDYVFYYNRNVGIVVIWNYKRRRETGFETSNILSLNTNWTDINIETCGIEEKYRTFKTKGGPSYYEMVLLVFEDCLIEVIEQIDQLMSLDLNFYGLPKHVNNDYHELENERVRENVNRLKRHYAFRKSVIERYGGKCAICRCSEIKLLEAAHIKSVSENGSDDPRNGICLCPNHHTMFDRGLIDIDFENKKLNMVAQSVKNMAWFTEFFDSYKGKVLEPLK